MSREQRAKVDAIMRQPRPAPRSIEEMRAGYAASQANNIVPDAVVTSEATLAGRRALVIEPQGQPVPGVILYFHGGAFSLGAPETSLSLTGNLVTRSRVRALSLDYRLAPEHPFPAGVDDAFGAYRALLDAGEDPARIVLAGDSAGGGLAVTTTLQAREHGLPLPAGIVTFSAGLDLTLSGGSMESRSDADPLFNRAMLAAAAAIYCTGRDVGEPLLSPAVSADLAGFPPMLLQVGTNEVLLDDSTRMADRAIAAGVDVALDVTADVPHVFQAFAGFLDEADQALDRAALFVTQRLAG